MQRKKLVKLMQILEKEEKQAKIRARELRFVANETAKSTVSSWSAGGDRFHTRSQSEAAEELYQKIISLRRKVEEEVAKSVTERISEPCFVNLILNGKKEEFYLVDQVVNLPEIKLISSDSLLGKTIIGKKINEDFSFLTEDGRKTEGKIISFE
ncbi:hypothetical protein A2159_00230 [Candidatus Woesebacteria bacterium RBG_13_34_9]|uniref:Transcription elongation factor GreA/GreB C-terminal domain-containing protein n=1 Tax=Candidatus Woesebacteria bacterium RBG_13_34_9 TaxID=1802477 RepID=A0A1F7X392_9BACT|nr:MAG: hypothetical protein A2159_00230 [Candidatus Woesebacteria bacterium RBG_13_34_9]